MQILWRRRCSRVVDLKLPDVQERELVFEIIKQIQIFVLFLYDLWPRWIATLKEKHVSLSKQENENFGVFENTLKKGS